MKRLTYARANRLPQLHDELIAALPALKPVMRVEGTATDVWLTVPDDADEAAIAAVIAAHVPAPNKVLPAAPDGAALDVLRQAAASSTTFTTAQLSAVVRALIAVLRHRSGDL